MRNLLRYFLMALVLLAVALLSALTAMRLAIHGREVSVPDLRGKTPIEARRIADDAGLAASVERNYYSATILEGRVLSQMPNPGTVVRRGWEIRLALSLGPQRVTVPQLVGGSERAAALGAGSLQLLHAVDLLGSRNRRQPHHHDRPDCDRRQRAKPEAKYPASRRTHRHPQ